MTINIDSNIIKNIEDYCKLNGKDFDYELNDIIRIGFSIKKYGNSPFQKMKEQNSMNNTVKEEVKEKVEVIEENKYAISKNSIDSLIDNTEPIKPKKKVRIIKTK